MPTIEHIRPNFVCVRTETMTMWFSYKTLVAFQVIGLSRFVRENDWGPTTGKHLNMIDNSDKATRLPSAKFQEAYATMSAPVGA